MPTQEDPTSIPLRGLDVFKVLPSQESQEAPKFTHRVQMDDNNTMDEVGSTSLQHIISRAEMGLNNEGNEIPLTQMLERFNIRFEQERADNEA